MDVIISMVDTLLITDIFFYQIICTHQLYHHLSITNTIITHLIVLYYIERFLYFLHLLCYNDWIAFPDFLCTMLFVVKVALVFITVTMY